MQFFDRDKNMDPAGRILSSWAASLKWRDLPEDLRAKVIDHVVDTIGVMFSGLEIKACQSAHRTALLWGIADESAVIGTSSRLPAPNAAFLNALNGRIHTFDDTYEPGTMHAGSSVIAAALALAEKHNLDGETFLVGVLAGYEVASRVAAAVSPSHYASGFHNTGTCTVFGTTITACRMLELDETATAEALGLAGAMAGGLRQHQIDGSMFDSAFHGAKAAQSGVMAAQMRAEGAGGPPAILEGPLGFCAVMAKSSDISRLTEQLGTQYEFSKTTIKPYPTCRFVHGPIEAALALKRQHGINVENIRSVTVATFKQSIEVSSRPELRTAYDAVVSHQYSVALALTQDKVELAGITNFKAHDPSAIALMRKVEVLHDDDLERDFPRCWPHRVTIETKNNEIFTLLSEYPPGRVTPISRIVIDAKFLDQTTPYLSEHGARRALQSLRDIGQADNMRVVIETLTT